MDKASGWPPVTPRISIALCTYNGAEFLAEQLASICAQTRLPDQLVVFDDGSTDRTVDIVHEVARSGPFTVDLHVNAATRGVTKNFEAAIERCDGDIIFLADQDDLWVPHKVASTLEAFAREPDAGFAFSNALLVDGAGRGLDKTLWDVSGVTQQGWPGGDAEAQLRMLLAGANVVYGNTLAFRASWKSAIVPIDSSTRYMTHDMWIATLLCALGAPGVAIDSCLVRYRQHSQQASGGMIASNRLAYFVAHHLRSRANEFVGLASACDLLLARLRSQSDDGSRWAQQLIAARRDHLRVRAAMHETSVLRRTRMAVEELASGRYSRFSSSYMSALKDIVLG
jgi:glycosyltransferase involved in cell wall biosynthesis